MWLLWLGFAACDDREGPKAAPAESVDADADGWVFGEDCDDNDALSYPFAPELCDFLDNDCDDLVDEDAIDASFYYADLDGDSYGAGEGLALCNPSMHTAAIAGDCDDTDADVHPWATEICNDFDDDCDGIDDEDLPLSTFYRDVDGDGYGIDTDTKKLCAAVPGYVAVAGDCDELTSAVNPGVLEDWTNTVDENCDGVQQIETPVDVEGSCAEHVWDAPTEGQTKVRMLSVLDASNAPGGRIQVHHDVPESVILFLHSTGVVEWEVTETWPGAVKEVWISCGEWGGCGISVPTSSTYEVALDYYDEATDWDAFATQSVRYWAEEGIGLPLTSFHGCSSPESFTITAADTWPVRTEYPDCDEMDPVAFGEPEAADLPAVCDTAASDATLCMSTSGNTVNLVGLDSGSSCEVTTTGATFDSAYGRSIAWLDDALYACVQAPGVTSYGMSWGMLTRISLADGSIEKSLQYCNGVAVHDGQLYRGDGYGDEELYATWKDVVCGTPTSTAPALRQVVTIDDAIVYGTDTWGHELWSKDIATGTTASVDLDGFQDDIWGIDVEDGELLLLSSYSIEAFDVATGDQVGAYDLPAGFGYGLSCTP